jgi:hypothetical protein
MEIQVHPAHVKIDQAGVEATVARALDRFGERLTRVEVYLRDENADKGGIDKHCLLEARPRGLDPITAGHQAGTLLDALTGAVSKLERALDHRLGRLGER